MNTYTVVYYPPTGPAVGPMQVQAKEFVVDNDYVVFADDTGRAVLAIPTALDPVIQRTAVSA